MILMRTFVIVFFGLIVRVSASQSLSTDEQQLERWLPTQIGEYVLDGVPMTVTSRVEDKPYIMSSKNFKKDKSILEIVVFDYKAVPDLLKKYTTSWESQTVDDESQKVSPTVVDGFKAWESTDKKKKAVQLYVNVKDRYLLFLSGTEMAVEYLKKVAIELKPRQLPK
jgi:hypothetical protein